MIQCLAMLLVAAAAEAQPGEAEADAGVDFVDVDGGTNVAPPADGPADAGSDAPLAAAEPDAGVPEPKSMSTVVVGTSEERTAGSVHTIKGSRLKRFELDDPSAVLQAVPGVYVRTEDG